MHSQRLQETFNRRYRQGFTLLELLVVVVIVAILFTYTTLAIRSDSPEEQVQEEAQRLEQLIRLALEEATLRGEEYGIEFETNRYRFVRFSQNRWISLGTDKIFYDRELPENMEIELSLEDTEIIIDPGGRQSDPDETGDEDDGRFEPQVFLLSSGEITPEFSIRFYILGVEASYFVNGQFDGSLKTEVSDL